MNHHWPTVDAALRWAHYWQIKTLIKSPSVQRSSKGSDPLALTQLDSVAQAAMILSHVRRVLPEVDHEVITLLYTVPGDAVTQAQKERNAMLVGERISRSLGRDKWWVVDILRHWSGVRAHHTQEWWAKHLNVTPVTLRRWARAKNDSGIYTVVERDLCRAKDKLSDSLRDLIMDS